MPSRLFVTGATGFIGRAAVPALLDAGHGVRALVRDPARLVPGAEGVIGSLGTEVAWETALRGVDTVLHLAARAHVLKEGAGDPLAEFRRVNRDATLALARASAAAGVRRFVFLSSIGVLGERTAPGRPFTTGSVPAPSAPYAVSKFEAEQGLAAVAAETGIEVVIIRPPLVHGPGAPGNFGRLVRLVARGWPLPLAGLSNRRTFVGRRNLVDLILTALDHPGAPGAPLLAGDDRSITTSELLMILGDALGRPARLFGVPGLPLFGHLPAIGGAIRKLTDPLEVDISATTARLGWTPRVSVEEGLAEMARAWKESR